ncbi:MarR family winged helix-turn-helix transcriptional regulator [Yinghuangia soli]|uniref:MarR family winged helix-turn-helix transcriptional regulator n=1 Tax=Yinghuangia soli TaxID=2908204 RepID=A0AA41Q850_9ACTN|nr:MarR family winged helix-turn-helix transcriptional regulator [Yinghuangia soli]MCF2531942.1 MarR family winged helix-turn-helix transcriptional regulator [Yinghuangia soli]
MVERRSRGTAEASPDSPGSPGPPGSPDSPAAPASGAADPGDRVIRAIQQFTRSPAHAELSRALYRAGGKDLTPAQVDALETLAAQPEWHMHEFARALDINQGAASRTAERLVRLGLAERQPDAADRRYVVVRATTTGRRAAGRIRRDRHALMQEVLGGLDDTRRTALAELLEHLTEAMEATLARRTGTAADPADAAAAEPANAG